MSEIKYVNADIILWGLIIFALYVMWGLSRMEFIYTKSLYRCLLCGYEYESRHNRIVDLVMFLHRIVCRGK